MHFQHTAVSVDAAVLDGRRAQSLGRVKGDALLSGFNRSNVRIASRFAAETVWGQP